MQSLIILVPLIPIVGLIMALITGLVGIVSPKTIWYLQTGWKYKNAEPSNVALFMHRIGGIGIIAGVIAFLIFVENFFHTFLNTGFIP